MRLYGSNDDCRSVISTVSKNESRLFDFCELEFDCVLASSSPLLNTGCSSGLIGGMPADELLVWRVLMFRHFDDVLCYDDGLKNWA
jgi:hypothetical protein